MVSFSARARLSTAAAAGDQAGTGEVEVLRASTPAAVMVDPEQACRDAVNVGLIVHRAHPLNCETDLGALIGGVVMPNARFYVRNHFHIPRLASPAWRLSVRGHVGRSLSLSLSELRTMRSQALVATLECAGNGRSRFSPPTAGEQWRLGAVSTAEWTGVPVSELLERCGPRTSARELLFRGADAGSVPGRRVPVRYERSLRLDEAVRSGALLAYAMNGEPLPTRHGYPLRLVVPGWFAMASVKWLTEIELIDHEFTGRFQTETYQYETAAGERAPVTRQNLRSLIVEPAAGERRASGAMTIRGVAWSGEAPVRTVEVSVEHGPWMRASVVGDPVRHAWRWWELLTRIERAGAVSLRARATDEAGRTQPGRAPWNRMGYGNNAIHDVEMVVR
ncbi:MAG: sulfite oxidase [Solirubrobacterales bacterium]|nr:sulfite oxidase [Solirubrobacterales bacterium]MBV9715291.1 sulfite oxidase [Solirubrobacterales bacterium]